MSERQRNKYKRVVDIFRSAYPDQQIVQIDPPTLNHLSWIIHKLHWNAYKRH
jgi:hypothetical protein